MTAGSIRGYRQHGIGLLEVTLLLALVSVLVVLGIQTLRGPLFAERARDQADALVWADQALAGFAASHGRLPCPASQADGVERCDLGQAKGWLPTATLAADGAGRLPGQGQIRYLVYRHDEDDLTRLQDLFNPQGSGGKVYDFGQINEMDLCLRLQQADQVPPGPVAAHIAAAGAAGVINIAYGVAAPGIDADSDGSLFDGANAGAGPVLERPDREPGPGYDDRVRVRDFNTLAQALGCEFMATGHYVRRVDGQYGAELHRGRDDDKDQTYFLWALPREILQYLLFPLGDMTKEEVRAIAAEQGFSVAEKPSSHGLCFISTSVKDYLKDNTEAKPGPVLDASDGYREIGRHDGIQYYTIGQRKGLNLTHSHLVRFVTELRPEDNAVIVGTKEMCQWRGLKADTLNLLCDPAELTDRVMAQVRYRQKPVPARLKMNGDGFELEFDEPMFAVAPGQSAVLYDGDRLLGGGIIRERLTLH